MKPWAILGMRAHAAHDAYACLLIVATPQALPFVNGAGGYSPGARSAFRYNLRRSH